VPIAAGGLDIRRKQIAFDYLDTVTGEVRRGQVRPADRLHLRGWLARFAGRDDAAFAVEGCAGWRYAAGELAAAGIAAHLAGPAGTAARRGRKRHAKAGRTDARRLRVLLAEGRLPECWIPPGRIVECRALLELYNDLRRERTARAQRIHAVLFRQGAPALGEGALRTGQGVAGLRDAAAGCLPAAGRLQVAARAGGDRGAGGPAARGAASADRCGPAPGRGEGAGRAAVRGRAGDRAGDHLPAGRGGPVLPLPPGGPVRRAGSSPSRPRTARARPGGCPGSGRRCCAGRSARRARPTPVPRRRTTATTRRSRTARTASAPPCPGPARSSGRPVTSWPGPAATRSLPPETLAMVTNT